jgi:DNA-binding transcriptional LysR family regulator
MHLKYATQVAEMGSISKAAEKLLMGQPNLSRAIRDLEESIGISIFNRTSKGISVTPEGEEFLVYARKILSQIDEVEAIYEQGMSAKQHFSVSVPRASYISEAFSKFSAEIGLDPAELFYKETNSLRTLRNVLNSEYKLGIIRYAERYDGYFKNMFEEKGLEYEIVAEFNRDLIINKDSQLAKKNIIKSADLKDYIEITHADPFVPSVPIALVKKEEWAENVPRRIFVFERASEFNLLAENKNTFMWGSPISQKLLDIHGLIKRECADKKRRYKDVLIYRRGYKFSKLDEMFIEKVKNEIGN